MRGDGAAGWASGGCAGFSLLGLLVGVGLTVWLASLAFPGSSSSDRGTRSRTTTSAGGAAPPTTAAGLEVAVEVAPATGIAEGGTVRVSASGFAPGGPVTVATCLHRGDQLVGTDTCDRSAARPVTADPTGRVAVDFQPSRIVSAGTLPFDCATGPNVCEVRVTAAGEVPRSGSTPFSFAEGLPAPVVTLPG